MTPHLPPLPSPIISNASDHDVHSNMDANAVHLWLLDTDRFTEAHAADAEQIISPGERERAQKFIRGKETYIASRWLLRTTLARYTGVAPAAVAFARTAKGKPFLAHSDIQFNLSHSGHWALLAVTRAELIGVDVEAVRTTRDLSGIAESYYHPQEFAQLQLLAGSERYDYFYRLWTLKEAFLKALGVGISAGLDKAAFELREPGIRVQIADELGGDANDEWQFHQWALSAQDYCALACKAPNNLQVKWFDALAAPAFP